MKLQKLDLHTRTFRSFFAAVAGTLMLMAAFAPSAILRPMLLVRRILILAAE